MSDDQTRTRKRPDFTVYFVAARENARWQPIGAAWGHSDGEGFNLKLDLLPNTDGHIVLRKPKAEQAGGEE